MDNFKAKLKRYWGAFAIPLVFVAIVAAMWAVPHTRLIFQTSYFVVEMFGEPPNNPYEWATEAPVRERVQYSGVVDGRAVEFQADVYSPGGDGRHGAVVGVVGALQQGVDDPRLIRLAEGVARLGVVMMLPEMDDLVEDRLVPEEIDEVTLAFQKLRERENVDPDKVAIVGFSVGAGPALIAASHESISDQIEFVGSLGGYYDIFDLIASISTKTLIDDGVQRPWDVSPRSQQILRRSLISYVDDPAEQEMLSAIFANGIPINETALGDLSPTGRMVYDILSNASTDLVYNRFASAPHDVVTILRRLSPSIHLDGLDTNLFLVHDRNDRFIPYVESRRLAENLPPSVNLSYLELDIFRHTIPRVSSDPLAFILELMQFFFLAYRMALQLI